MAETKLISITNLLLNPENYRFDPVSSQKEAIEVMLNEQKDKLYRLAEDILKNGLNPSEKIQVVESELKNRFLILEGNRRITALKILNNPEIIQENLKYYKKFRKLAIDNESNIITEIECYVHDSSDDAKKWILLKHTGENGGIGVVNWDTRQKRRFENEGATKGYKLIEYLKDINPKEKDYLDTVKITNLDRLLDDPDVRLYLDVGFDKSGINLPENEGLFLKKVNLIIDTINKREFNVKDIYYKTDRKTFIDKINSILVSKTKNSIDENPNSSNSSSNKSPNFDINNSADNSETNLDSKKKDSSKSTNPKPKKNPTTRKTLIPKNCNFVIDTPKINCLYQELQKIDVEKFKNTVSVSFRVFVELSLDIYIEKNNLNSVTKDSPLKRKAQEIANDLEKNKGVDKHLLKGIRASVTGIHSLFSIDTWHAYVHNGKFSATKENLIITWNNIQPFLEKLWENSQ